MTNSDERAEDDVDSMEESNESNPPKPTDHPTIRTSDPFNKTVETEGFLADEDTTSSPGDDYGATRQIGMMGKDELPDGFDSDDFDIVDDEESDEPPELQPGDTLGKYLIKKKLGQGGMASVYLGFDPMIEREVAIKVLPVSISSKSNALDRFLTEARSTGKLNHANVVSIFDISEDEGTYFIVMELVRGGSVAEYIDERESIDWKEAARIAAEAAEGLGAAHAAGLIHRDIKPENLMIAEDGTTKVVDFGLSKLTDSANESRLGITNPGQVMGTPHYMSPEQFEGEDVDARSDVYGLGGTFFTLLTGQPPFAGSANLVNLINAHLSKSPPNPSDVNTDVPASIDAIVSRALSKDKKQRFENAQSMAAEIRAVLQGVPASSSTPGSRTSLQLMSACIIQPSKMQSMMWAADLRRIGAKLVAQCSSIAEARQSLASESPDLVVTAHQLPDATGTEFLHQLRDDESFRDTVLVLNSSETELDQFSSWNSLEPLAVVSKKTKPAKLLSVLREFTHLEFNEVRESVDSSSIHVAFVADSTRLPEPVVQLIRDAGLLDFEVRSFDELAAGRSFSDAVQCAIALRIAGDAENDDFLYVDLLERLKLDASLKIALQVSGPALTLRAAQIPEITCISRCDLSADRMKRVLQLCHSAQS